MARTHAQIREEGYQAGRDEALNTLTVNDAAKILYRQLDRAMEDCDIAQERINRLEGAVNQIADLED